MISFFLVLLPKFWAHFSFVRPDPSSR